MPFAAICADLEVPRDTVAGWLYRTRDKSRSQPDLRCPFCTEPARAVDDPAWYAYLLGMYLGDGHLLLTRRVPLLTVACDLRYPGVIAEIEAAMLACGARRVGHQRREGRDAVRSSWMHWPCLLPQHGIGKKHDRTITLTAWQRAVVDVFPGQFLRGLFHSDGCRTENKVHAAGKVYAYPRYMFTNKSADIMRLCQDALDRSGVRWRMCSPIQLSVARREGVVVLDGVVGAKC
ncbi:transcriptional regulator [Nucisporomicrobium flavum]|uniref:transcriptional regulator n=1 Tax=Nucisporomicrobium flavum TaxID=2785915 RepID=UPI0027DE06C6|nr:transcriptional regulator [Nucisporomicrobium flavum]